jgi:cation:H+ antiporter
MLPLYANLVAFAALAAAVWFAGTRLSYLADAIGARIGVGHAIMGFLFLAALTELPELVTTAAAAVQGDAALALNNMFGGITMQTAILAVADAVAVGATLTVFPRKPTTMLEAAFLILLLAGTLLAIQLGDTVVVLKIGGGVLLLALGYGLAAYLVTAQDEDYAWRPVAREGPKQGQDRWVQQFRALSLRELALQSAGAALVILVCGVLLVEVAQAIADQSGLGSSFVGATLLATSTSLPELSTTIAAVRMHAYSMAISNIFGSNLIMLLVLLPADLLYRDGAILREAGPSARLALLFGILVTAVYLIGLIIKKKPRYFGMGVDSITVLVLYAISLVALYSVRGP